MLVIKLTSIKRITIQFPSLCFSSARHHSSRNLVLPPLNGLFKDLQLNYHSFCLTLINIENPTQPFTIVFVLYFKRLVISSISLFYEFYFIQCLKNRLQLDYFANFLYLFPGVNTQCSLNI